jgi:diadenosine tetraphosphate (Ap4A) HIT family hydrolase
MGKEYERAHFDVRRYEAAVTSSPCFICGIVNGTLERRHHVVYRDGEFIAFLNAFPTLVGYVLVAPLAHREAVVTDFTAEEYLRLQRVIHRVGRAIATALPTERLYVMSLGANRGNAHVHWHLAPLPPGVPYSEQQFNALRADDKGYLSIPEADMAEIAARIAAAVPDA